QGRAGSRPFPDGAGRPIGAPGPPVVLGGPGQSPGGRRGKGREATAPAPGLPDGRRGVGRGVRDRKSTRLNSSHVKISYAVFCLHLRPPARTSTLSLHDALPISGASRVPPFSRRCWASYWCSWPSGCFGRAGAKPRRPAGKRPGSHSTGPWPTRWPAWCWPGGSRSEEHTSELQSRENLVCRLLLALAAARPHLHSFPTRRSSDLRGEPGPALFPTVLGVLLVLLALRLFWEGRGKAQEAGGEKAGKPQHRPLAYPMAGVVLAGGF